MSIPFRHTRVATAMAGVALSLCGGHALGSAFALAEQNVMGLGNAFAGSGATAEDANTLWFNPAGLGRLALTQVEVAAHAVRPSSKLNDNGSQAAALQPLGSTGGDAGDLALVPNLYGMTAITPTLRLGLGINAPFGLKTEYDNGWLGRYQALKSEIKTVNVNPAIGWRATDRFWLGAGLNYQHLKATLTNNVNYSAILASRGYPQLVAAGAISPAAAQQLSAATAGLDSFASITADDGAWGWNLGAMWSFNGDANNEVGASRLGLAYRSKIKYTLEGTVSFDNPAIPTLPGNFAPLTGTVRTVAGAINQAALFNGGVRADLEMPDTASLSYYHRLTERWELLGDVTWTGWSSIKAIRIVRTTGDELSTLVQNYKNTWRYSLGVNYNASEKLVLRGGVAFDQTPVNDTDRSARLPDSDRTWLALGARWKYTSAINFDVAGAYIFMKNAPINSVGSGTSANPPSAAANGLVKGDYDNSVWIVSAQMNYRFR
jgi:long-chain fatty acid transport protein